jgi:hypothetical protein
VTDPITTSIATALATATTTALTDGSRALTTKLAAFLRERFRRDPAGQDALEAATHGPRDHAAVQRLAELLDQRMRDDPVFAQRLRALWADAPTADSQHPDEITNTFSGPVQGSVIQARDVSGGINVNEPPRPHPPQR